ncbi:MAG: protoheme IX farnesyltransferase [Flavobacteriales bacterium]|nr:protoheme IX farnesyltransferase [Flavobacteriales bacterium]MBK7246319.1 protoheme IX farnesyltransferase [Flavobacteriales bacterium]MBK7286090.1 protoheme IX farnesyltransferase [Flavobacteriales bacterium]MBK9059907.1 protoheme IX farnesyltransferase [Flavobacteriales bacterium]QQS72012.1 MAG: protoheme IX farnesyltransferase [Flavobacteriales bacterium]
METRETYTVRIGAVAKVKDLAALFKLRLASLVVVSAVLGYGMGVPIGGFSIVNALLLTVGGLLVTGASNALNQVIEVEQDSLMSRTAERPLVRRSMSMTEATVAALLAGAVGTFILWDTFGPLTGILGLLSLFMYVALYTPMKRFSSWAVFVGAFPGAFPPMLGYVAATGQFGLGPGLLFAMQFMWQFPHFWSIAWVLNDDYAKAGYHLLPSRGGRDRYSGFLIVLYTFFALLTGLLPWVFGLAGPWSALTAALLGLWMLLHALRLMRSLDKADARRLMFASFLYLPVVQLAYVLDKL